MSMILLYISYKGVNFGKGYIVTVLFAFTFHYVAIAALLIPLMMQTKWDFKKSVFVLLAVIIVGNIVALRFGDFLRVLESVYAGLGRYNEMYSNHETYTSRLNLFGQLQVFFLQIVPFMIPLLVYSKKRLDQKTLNVVTLLYGIFVLLGTYVSILNRISYLYTIPAIAMIGNYLVEYRYKFNRSIKCLAVLLLLMNVYVFYNQEDGYGFKNIQKLYPYSSILDKSVDREREYWIDRVVYF